MELVTDKPWGAYNWYDGNLRSLIEFNTDLPVRATALVSTLSHETFPGHHLEHASKEQRLVREQDRLEATIQLINTPEAYISEGLAEVGLRFVAPEGRWQELFIGACEIARIPMSPADADREWLTVKQLRATCVAAAAMLRCSCTSTADRTTMSSPSWSRRHWCTRDRAEKSLDFVTHPLWRTYVFCYAGGERLLNRWLDAAPDEAEARNRFARLLTEQLTPSGIAEQIGQESPVPA